MRIIAIREAAVPIASAIRNAYIDFSLMTASIVAVVTDVVRDGKPVALLVPDQSGNDPLGTPLMPNAALLVRGAPHPAQARAFIDFLTSAEAERILADSAAAQYPLHAGTAGPSQLPPLDQLRILQVDYDDVARKLPVMDASLEEIFGL